MAGDLVGYMGKGSEIGGQGGLKHPAQKLKGPVAHFIATWVWP